MSELRSSHRNIRAFYADDASKYEADNNKKLIHPGVHLNKVLAEKVVIRRQISQKNVQILSWII